MEDYKEVKNFMAKQNTWFFYNESYGNGCISYDSREYGSVGSEEAGVEDIREANRLIKLFKKQFGDKYKIYGNVVDEWVMITIK
jgi:hypothetical protein